MPTEKWPAPQATILFVLFLTFLYNTIVTVVLAHVQHICSGPHILLE